MTKRKVAKEELSLDLDFFERIIIQNSLKKDTPYLASIIEYIDDDIFKDKDISPIIGVIKKFYLERNSIPSLTELKARLNTPELRDSIKKVVQYIKGLDGGYNEMELLTNTELFIKQRKFAKLMERAIDEKVSNKQYDLLSIQAEANVINSITLMDNLGLDYFEDVERIAQYLQEKDNLLSTGYPSLDAAFGGGFQAEGKAIYDIGGETNVGKSIFLANIALNLIIQDKNVVLISPEMSEMRYARRITGMLTGIAISTLGENVERYRSDIEAFKKRHMSKLIIKEVPTRSASAKSVSAYLKKLKDKKGFIPNLIAIDGHGLFRSSTPQVAKHTELQVITQEFRALTYEHNAPALTVAQLNRGSHKANNPGLDNLAGSWDQLADFDGHVNIWQTDEDRDASIIRFGGKKVRDGAKGSEGFLTIDYDTLRLREDGSNLDDMELVKGLSNIQGMSLDDILDS